MSTAPAGGCPDTHHVETGRWWGGRPGSPLMTRLKVASWAPAACPMVATIWSKPRCSPGARSRALVASLVARSSRSRRRSSRSA